MPHQHEGHREHEHRHHIDPGSFLLGQTLARMEGKLDRLTHQVARLNATTLATRALAEKTHARVEQIANALDIGREAASLTLIAEDPTLETR